MTEFNFDTVFDEDFDDKLAGIETRRKIRLRIYDTESDFALFLMKPCRRTIWTL